MQGTVYLQVGDLNSAIRSRKNLRPRPRSRPPAGVPSHERGDGLVCRAGRSERQQGRNLNSRSIWRRTGSIPQWVRCERVLALERRRIRGFPCRANPPRTCTLRYAAAGRRRSSFLAPTGAGLSAFSGHSWQRLPGRASLQGVSLDAPAAEPAVVDVPSRPQYPRDRRGNLSLRVRRGAGYSTTSPPFVWWAPGAVGLGYVVLRMILKRL